MPTTQTHICADKHTPMKVISQAHTIINMYANANVLFISMHRNKNTLRQTNRVIPPERHTDRQTDTPPGAR